MTGLSRIGVETVNVLVRAIGVSFCFIAAAGCPRSRSRLVLAGRGLAARYQKRNGETKNTFIWKQPATRRQTGPASGHERADASYGENLTLDTRFRGRTSVESRCGAVAVG